MHIQAVQPLLTSPFDYGVKGTDVFDYGTKGTTAHDHGSPGTTGFDYGAKSTDEVSDHAHNIMVYYLNTSGQLALVGAGGYYTSPGVQATAAAGAHAHNVPIGAHAHTVALGSHGHTVTVNAAGNAENTIKKHRI